MHEPGVWRPVFFLRAQSHRGHSEVSFIKLYAQVRTPSTGCETRCFGLWTSGVGGIRLVFCGANLFKIAFDAARFSRHANSPAVPDELVRKKYPFFLGNHHH